MRTNQPVHNNDDLLSVVDHLLEEELGLKRSDIGGKVTFFTNSGSRDDTIPIVRRQTGTGERENGRFVQRSAARGG